MRQAGVGVKEALGTVEVRKSRFPGPFKRGTGPRMTEKGTGEARIYG